MDFTRAIGLLHGFLAEHGIGHALIGGLALAAYGLPRTTLDLDLAVDGQHQDTVITFLEGSGYATFYRSVGYSNHVHPDAALGRVDCVWVRGETAVRVFAGAQVLPGPGGTPLPVLKPEHLAAMKLLAVKNDPSRKHRDLEDIRFLLGLPGVDRSELEAYARRHGLEAILDGV